VVACLIIVVLIITNVSIIVTILIIVRLFIIWLKTTLISVLTLGTEASLGFAHLVKLGVVAVIRIVFEDLVLLILEVLVFQLFDDLLLLLAPLVVLQIVHVELILQVVDVGVLLDVGAVEAFELGLESLVLLLEFGLDVFDAL